MGRKSLEEKALKLFGETENITDAGWILPNGQLVYWGDSHEWMAIKINDGSVNDFLQRGWIRTQNQGGECGDEAGIEISADIEPTIPQLRRICEFAEKTDKKCFLVEWTSKDGKHLLKELSPDPEEVMYCMGAMHTVGFDEVYKEYNRRKDEGGRENDTLEKADEP